MLLVFMIIAVLTPDLFDSVLIITFIFLEFGSNLLYVSAITAFLTVIAISVSTTLTSLYVLFMKIVNFSSSHPYFKTTVSSTYLSVTCSSQHSVDTPALSAQKHFYSSSTNYSTLQFYS